MNTGIQDAINMGWKLAFAPTAADREGLLDSYDLERRPVARSTLLRCILAPWRLPQRLFCSVGAG
jgi:2-polyprenyl-6-methoxyphenol hydroxylase-like FAD-dependent oxidoreductase